MGGGCDCRCLASPQEACHFVSLIEPKLEWDQDVYSGAVGHFLASTHTIIAAGLANPVQLIQLQLQNTPNLFSFTKMFEIWETLSKS